MNAKVLIVRFGPRLAEQRARGHFKAWEECILLEHLSRRVEGMLADLGLPACKLTIRVAGPEERTSRFLFSVELEDSTCFGPLDNESNTLPSAEQLAVLIATILFVHRDTLLAPAVRDHAWERLKEDLSANLIPRHAFDDIVAAAIRHGLHVPDAVDKLVKLFKGGLHRGEFSDQVETILATQAEPVVRVHVGTMDGLEEETLSDKIRDRLFFETGLIFPPLKFASDGELAAGEFRLTLNRLWTPVTRFDSEALADSLVRQLRHHGPVFTTTTAVDSALGRLCKAFPMVVFNTIEVFGTASTLRVLRALVDEGVDIRDLRGILGAMLEANGTLPARHEQLAVFLPYEATFFPEVSGGKGRAKIDRYVGCVRAQLRDQISQACADSNRVLHGVRLAPTLETRLSRLDHDPLGEDETFELLSAATRSAGTGPVGTVLLASSRNRRRLWELIRQELPHVPVLCEAEISPYVRYEKAGEIGAV